VKGAPTDAIAGCIGMRSALTRSSLLMALTGTAGLLSPIPASAAEPERLHLSYNVPAECPSEGDFLDMVARDGGLLVRAADDELARSFAVRVQVSGSVDGWLVVRGVDGSEAARAIAGGRCDDVVRSLAVLVALSVEPGASSSPVPSAPDASVEGAPTTLERPTAPDAVRPRRLRGAISAEGTLGGGAAPGAVPAVAAYIELLRDAPGAFEPSVRLGGEISATWTTSVMGPDTFVPRSGLVLPGSTVGETTFQKLAARLDACPLRWLAARPWANDALSAQACARFEAGQLEAHARGFPNAKDARRLWAAAAPLLRLRWIFPAVFFEVEGGVVFPFARERFFMEPSTLVFEVPAVTGTLGLGFGALFL
jgi:hypothetical protein